MLRKTLPNGQVLEYDYGPDPEHPALVMPRDEPDSLMPRLQSIEDQAGRRVEYVFDALGTLVEAKTNMQYEGEGGNRHLARYLLAQYEPETLEVNGTPYTRWLTASVVNTWNEFDEQTQQWLDAVQLSANAYTYDSGGNRLTNTITYPDTSSRTEAYGYDALSRLIGVDYEYSGGTPVFDAGWCYDAVGNRQPADDPDSNVYNAANMLTQTGASYYTNDLNGNTLTGGGRTSVWDSQNRLVQTAFGGTTTGFTYGPDGLRRTATSGGVTTQYILDGQNVAQEVSPSGTVRHIWGPRGPERRISTSGNPLWFVYDGHGNVIAEVGEPDENGNTVEGMRNHGPWRGITQSGTLVAPLDYMLVADALDQSGICGELIEFEAGRVARASA